MMIDKDWDAIPYVDGDCIRDEDEWNAMITYIKHSAASTFTIYDDEDSSNQIFKFTHTGAISQMYGGDDTGDVFSWYANDFNAYPYIKLFGAGNIKCAIHTGAAFKIINGATEAMKVSYAANVTTVEGGAVAGDDLLLKGSSANLNSNILISGNGNIQYVCGGGAVHKFKEAGTVFLNLYEDGTNDVIEGSAAGNDLKIIGSEGIHNYFKVGEEFKMYSGTTEIFKTTYAVNITTIEGGAVTGDDSKWKANSIDNFPYIELDGNAALRLHTTAGSAINLYEGNTLFGQLKETTDFAIVSANNRNISLEPNGTGLVKFGTYTASTITHTGYITMKDAGGTDRLVMIGEV